MRKVILQLDYYLGGQFAGLATGLARGLFASRGLDVSIVAPCTPGNEGAAVVAHQRQMKDATVVGVCEQNSLAADAPLVAFGAMFSRRLAKLRSSSSLSPRSATRSTTIRR